MFYQVMRTKYDQFGGRAGRREFWLFMLVHFILSVIAGLLDDLVLVPDAEWYEAGPLFSIYWLITIVPILALGARRLHDTGRSGWYQLLMAFWVPTAFFVVVTAILGLIGIDTEAAFFGGLALVFFIAAVVGTLILFIFAVLPGDEAENAYGMPDNAPERPAVYWTVLTTRYVAFAGRAGRKEYWLYTLVGTLIVAGIAGTLDRWLFTTLSEDGTNPIQAILFLATLLPGLSLGARRLHDIGRSGWWQLLFIPPVIIVGWIVLLVFFVMPSQEGENSHGETAMAPE